MTTAWQMRDRRHTHKYPLSKCHMRCRGQVPKTAADIPPVPAHRSSLVLNLSWPASAPGPWNAAGSVPSCLHAGGGGRLLKQQQQKTTRIGKDARNRNLGRCWRRAAVEDGLAAPQKTKPGTPARATAPVSCDTACRGGHRPGRSRHARAPSSRAVEAARVSITGDG